MSARRVVSMARAKPMAYLTDQATAFHNDVLLCDPLTGLVAYPSFERFLQRWLPFTASLGVHLAIGDVDDLKAYVTRRRADDPTMFGHLAGNDCMRRVGAITAAWQGQVFEGWPFHVCATFGGDEVIVAAAGQRYEVFAEVVAALAEELRVSAPRPCSFAITTLEPCQVTTDQAADAYRLLVSHVDSALFAFKAERRLQNGRASPIIDTGTYALPASLGAGKGEVC